MVRSMAGHGCRITSNPPWVAGTGLPCRSTTSTTTPGSGFVAEPGLVAIAPGKGEITRTTASAQQYEAELQAMIDGLHNYPCIVMWVVFNEGWGQYESQALAKWVKAIDESRLVNANSGWLDMNVGDLFDIHTYQPEPLEPEHKSNRAIVIGEFHAERFCKEASRRQRSAARPSRGPGGLAPAPSG